MEIVKKIRGFNFIKDIDNEIKLENARKMLFKDTKTIYNEKINFRNKNISLNIMEQIPIDILEIQKKEMIDLE